MNIANVLTARVYNLLRIRVCPSKYCAGSFVVSNKIWNSVRTTIASEDSDAMWQIARGDVIP